MLEYFIIFALVLAPCLSEPSWMKLFSELCRGADKQYYVNENFPQCCPCSPCGGDPYLERVATCDDESNNCISYPGDCVEEQYFLKYFPGVASTTTTEIATHNTTLAPLNPPAPIEPSPTSDRQNTVVSFTVGILIAVVLAILIVSLFVSCHSSSRKCVLNGITKLKNRLWETKDNSTIQSSSQNNRSETVDLLTEHHGLVAEGATPCNKQPAPNEDPPDPNSLSGPLEMLQVPCVHSDASFNVDYQSDYLSNPRQLASQQNNGYQVRHEQLEPRRHFNGADRMVINPPGPATYIAQAAPHGTVNIHNLVVYNGSDHNNGHQRQNGIAHQQTIGPQSAFRSVEDQSRPVPCGQSSDTASRPIFVTQNDISCVTTNISPPLSRQADPRQSSSTVPSTPGRQSSQISSTSIGPVENQTYSDQSDNNGRCVPEFYSEARPIGIRSQHQPVPVQQGTRRIDQSELRGTARQCSQEDSEISILRPPTTDTTYFP